MLPVRRMVLLYRRPVVPWWRRVLAWLRRPRSRRCECGWRGRYALMSKTGPRCPFCESLV